MQLGGGVRARRRTFFAVARHGAFARGEGGVGDEVEVASGFVGAEDRSLDGGRFAAARTRGDVGEVAVQVVFEADDLAHVEVGLAKAGAGVGGEGGLVGEEDTGVVGAGGLEDWRFIG